MNDADRKAFEDWWWMSGEGDQREQRKAWQAACEWRDSQVGRPIATVVAGDPEGKNHMSWLLDIPCPVGTKFYELPPAAQINQQLVGALEEAKESIYNAQYVAALQKIEAALAAAKETK